MIKKIKLMTDYKCHPLWWYDSEKVGNINPESLPLSQKTITRLNAFADGNDQSLDWNYPPDTATPTDLEIELLEQEGVSLWQQLQTELKSEYDVVYFSIKLNKVVHNLSELEQRFLVKN